MSSITPRQRPPTTLGICIAAHFINDGLNMVLPLIMPILVVRYTLNLFEVGAILTCYSATTGVFQPLLGYASDITRYKKIYLASGLMLLGIGLYLIQFATSLPWILFFSFIAGVGFSVYHPVALSFVTTAYLERRGFGLGFHGVGGSLGPGVFPAVLGALIAAYGLGSSLLFSLIAAFLAGILVLHLPVGAEERRERRFRSSFTFIILVTAAITLLRAIFYYGTVVFIPTFLVSELHLDIVAAGVATSIMLISGIMSQPLGGHLSDKTGRRAVLGLSSLFMGLFFMLFLSIPYPTSLVLLVIFGFWISLGFPIASAVIGDHVPKESMSASFGIISGTSSVGGIIAPLLVGKLGDRLGLGNAMFLMTFFAFAATAVCLLLPKSAKPKK